MHYRLIVLVLSISISSQLLATQTDDSAWDLNQIDENQALALTFTESGDEQLANPDNEPNDAVYTYLDIVDENDNASTIAQNTV